MDFQSTALPTELSGHKRYFFMKLPETGIEPVRVLPRRILSPVRLPIPPLGLISICAVSAAQLIYQTRQSLSTDFLLFFKKVSPPQKKSGEISLLFHLWCNGIRLGHFLCLRCKICSANSLRMALWSYLNFTKESTSYRYCSIFFHP